MGLFAVFLILFYCVNGQNSNKTCTYIQAKVNDYLLTYVPYVCMAFGKSASGMFECQSNGQLKYSFYDDPNCAPSEIDSVENDIDISSTVNVDSDSAEITQYLCDSTDANDTCEFLDIRVYSSCDSFSSQFYDEVYIIDKCLQQYDGEEYYYSITECTWWNATIYRYDDDKCTQNQQIEQHIYDDSKVECSSTCRDLSNCRRNFTLCSTHPWSELMNRCYQWTPDVAKEFFCPSMASKIIVFVSIVLSFTVLYHVQC